MKRLISFIVLTAFCFPSLAFANFQDNANETLGFSGGTNSNTQWDSGNSWLELNSTGQTNGTGTFTSRIIDALASTTWSTFAWTPSQPYLKELPDSAASETAYGTGNADMSNNVLLLHMNESSGTLSDVSGSGITGTVTGATHSATGKLNTALSFDGNDYVSLGDVLESSISGQSTISMWVYPTSGTSETIIAKYNPATGKRQWGFSIVNSKPRMVMYGALNGLTYRLYQTDSTISLNAWHHIAYVSNNSGNDYHIYVDGSEVAGTQTNVGSFVSVQDSNEPVLIGAAEAGANYAFNGTIDELAVFGRNLSATEILNMYKRGADRLRFQVRSCNDAACSGESFVGPGASTSAYFEEQDSNTTALPSVSLSGIASSNRYFQYQATLETDSASYTPDIKTVTVGSSSIGVLYSSFPTGSGTTDLSGVGNLASVSSFKLANTSGSIQWANSLDVRQQDFNSYVTIGSNFVSLNDAALTSVFDSQSTVTLNVSDCTSNTIYYAGTYRTSASDIIANGQACSAGTTPACTNISCTGGVMTFTVPHFDGYAVSIGGSPAPVPEFSTVLFAFTLCGLFWYLSRATVPQIRVS